MPWCGPCRMVGPIVEEIAQEREDIAVGKINVDEEVELAMEFGVASIPTLVVVEHGEVMNKAIGYMPKAEIEELLGEKPPQKARWSFGAKGFLLLRPVCAILNINSTNRGL